MDHLTLRYYDAEMRYLREAAKEFAQTHPDRAAMLDLDKAGTPDPYVERLFEGFAFSMGRLREKIDDDLPELTEGLVSMLWPHYLRTIPSLSVVAFTPALQTVKMPGQTDRIRLDGYFSPGGFAEEDGLWPKGDTAFSGYQLLLEYFTFRDKFMFVHLNGLEGITPPAGAEYFDIEVVFSTPWPSELPVTDDAVRLHCVPVINLFTLEADPLTITGLESEYLLRPKRLQDGHTEIYSVDSVTGSNRTGDAEYVPFSSFRHKGGMMRRHAPPRYYHTRVKRSVTGLYDTWLILGGHQWEDDRLFEREAVSLQITGTNGQLPRRALQSTLLDRCEQVVSTQLSVRNLCKPTLPVYPPAEDRFHWRVLSHLGSGFLNMMSTAEVLRGTLALYNWQEDELNTRRLNMQHAKPHKRRPSLTPDTPNGRLAMNDIIPRKIKTGGDPRTLPDYTALRDELSKLTHPARPDVNWQHVEKLCLSLFEQNGVELQTLAWYTLARTQLAGLFGLNEGLAILEALISHQWGAMWPQPVHARMEILSSLNQRLQQRMRSLPLNYSDLSQLYQAEQRLTALGEVLQRLELKHHSQLDTLRTLMHNSAVRLENSEGATVSASSPAEEDNARNEAVKWVYVAQSEYPANVDVQTAIPGPMKKWKSFVAGMGTMLVISALALWGWQYLHRTDPLQAQLAASLSPLPVPLSPEQLKTLRQQSSLPKTAIAQTQQQLALLDKLSPDWSMTYSRKLTEQAEMLWPEQAKPLVQQWQQQRNAAALPTEQLNGWHQGMATLEKLGHRLNGLDEQKGKYMTVSELKSVVFSAMQSFNQSIPAEEQLRRLSQYPAGNVLPEGEKTQLELHLKQLATRYAQIKQDASAQ